jgi:hypothetical protein
MAATTVATTISDLGPYDAFIVVTPLLPWSLSG